MRRRKRLLEVLINLHPELTKDELLARVLCGEVFVSGERFRDPKAEIPREAVPEFRRRSFVSRGGGKLDPILDAWNVDAAGKVVLDAGASTGGFTHCLLERGARLVHAVDVGANQIHPRFRSDPRVRVREKTNIMDIETLDPEPAFAVCDLSFRSLRRAAKHILGLTTEGILISLVKPQFEWRSPPASFDGVVREREDLVRILKETAEDLKEEGVGILRIAESPLKGTSGNREFFFLLGTTVREKDLEAELEALV